MVPLMPAIGLVMVSAIHPVVPVCDGIVGFLIRGHRVKLPERHFDAALPMDNLDENLCSAPVGFGETDHLNNSMRTERRLFFKVSASCCEWEAQSPFQVVVPGQRTF